MIDSSGGGRGDDWGLKAGEHGGHLGSGQRFVSISNTVTIWQIKNAFVYDTHAAP